VRDYFHGNSDGQLTYTNVVAPYYRAKRPRTYYTNEAIKQPKRALELIKEALEHLKLSGFNASVLTSDDKDYVYALNVFYAGTRVNNWAKGLWPHAHHLNKPYKLGPGKKIFDYQITDMTSELTLGTFCHENGHLICDFPDLYDYGYKSNGAGKFCLMCLGGSRPREKNPAQIGAYLKRAAGWTSQSTLLQSGQTVTLTAGRNEFALHRKSATEYYLIENRNAAGRDIALGASGLAVWHVDELGSNDNELGSPSLHYECALVQADGLRELENDGDEGDDNDLFKAGHRDTLSAATTPNSNWWDTSPSGLHIAQISAAGPTMTFVVR
jgi:M6 family metalloprotease-like protein